MDKTIAQFLERAELFMARIEGSLTAGIAEPDWTYSIAYRYGKSRNGQGQLRPVRHVGAMALSSLQEIDKQREKVVRNTAQFVKGLPANNVLLTGARGTGKSSLVRACLNQFAPQGLRLIEVDKSDMVDLPLLVEMVDARTEKFIIFCDDLSFDEGDAGYKALKSALDGSVSATASNVLIYATSNRRHLLPEYHSENLTYSHSADGEVHPGEAVEEKISLSERFGLWVSFYPFSQSEYLCIVNHWLNHFGVELFDKSKVESEALIWALERGSRSGRVAHQFVQDFVGRSGGAE